ncbi:MAG: hypothetical protein GWN62_23740 [Aliifodinibius sp.]|nr:hypothetical protein [Fodinibius sp.]
MKKIVKVRLVCFILLSICKLAVSGEKEEHREFARIALDSVLADSKGELHPALAALFLRNDSVITNTPLWDEKSFADISVAFSENDYSPASYHKPGRSILEQLKSLASSEIEKTFSDLESATTVKSFENKDKNVVVNYLLHHLIALRLANRAGVNAANRHENLKSAFSYEAIALSYLVDAFSSAHMLIKHKFLSGLQPFNYRKAHSFFRNKGVFVINSKGEAWQTFGDGLMLWYEPTYRHVLDGATTSLREVLLVFHLAVASDTLPASLSSLKESLPPAHPVSTWLETRAGQNYYAVHKMPSLLCLPMPVSATWSKKSEVADEHRIHRRIHYPQLRESGLYDPDMDGIDPDFLLSKESVPDWLISGEFERDPNPDFAREIIKEDTNFASVRFTQPRSFPPSIYGVLLNAAGGGSFNGDLKSTIVLGAGFGLADNLLFFNNPSADLLYTRIFDNKDRHFITLTFGTGIVVEPIAFRFELGKAHEIDRRFDLFDYKIAAGIELPMLDLSFTYAGITSRIMVQRIFTGSSLHGVYFQIVLH